MTLHTLADRKSEHAYFAWMDLQDRRYRASLTPAQLIDYRRYLGELGDCPACGQNVELEHESGPDFAGEWWAVRCARCEACIESGCTGIEYDPTGRMVDVG